MVSGAMALLSLFCLIGSVVYFFLRQVRKSKLHSYVDQLVQDSEQLNAPCRIQIFRDSSQETDRLRKWQYAFSLNNGERQMLNDDCTIEFSTTVKDNALMGYGRGTYGGLSKHPSLDSPFIVEATDGGLIRLIAQPTFDYSGGDTKWKSNLVCHG